MSDLAEKVAQFPQEPGVYLMKGEGGKIIYVGKGANLRQRVRSYFRKERDSRYQIDFLLRKVRDIDFLVTTNEKEALLLENSLIKKHKPRYNIFLKDDKSYVSLKLSIKHPYPSLTVTRRIKKDGALYFGPYSSAASCRETADFIYRHFRLRTCSDREISNRSRPCLEYQIHRCTAPCVGYVSSSNYRAQVEQVRLFLVGKNDLLLNQIREKINQSAQEEKFEEAAHWRDLLEAVQTTLEDQKVVRHGGIHQDLISLYEEGNRGVIALLSIRDGSLVDSRYYPVTLADTTGNVLKSFVSQYYSLDVFIPDEILVSTAIDSSDLLSDLLTEKRGKKVFIRTPQKGERKELIELALKNAQSQFARLIDREGGMVDTLKGLQEKLDLSQPIHRMECYDISHISGQKSTGSRVVFMDGEPDKNEYRQYKIRIEGQPNDYAMMKEILGRRFGNIVGARHTVPLPDLIVIDGGQGQLNVVLQVLGEMGFSHIPVIAIAKGKGAGARAKGVWEGKKEEEIYLPHRKNPLILKKGSPELMLLQRLRDEAHRFAIKYHRKLRDEKWEDEN